MKKGKRFSNEEISEILFEMSAYYSMHGDEFKRRAYELAAEDVRIFPEEISELYRQEGIKGLEKIPSVGAAIADHIKELLTTGRFEKYEEFKKSIPVNLPELLSLSGVGPRTIKELWVHLKVRNLADLESACKQRKVRALPGFGAKKETKILEAIQVLRTE